MADSTKLQDSDLDESGNKTAVLDPAVGEGSSSWLSRLYTGTGAFEIIGRRRVYYIVTAVIIVAALLSIAVRGFTLGIDFEGGTRVQFPATDAIATSQVETVYSEALGTDPVAVQRVGSGSGATIQIRSEALDTDRASTLQSALFQAFSPVNSAGVATADAISFTDVSETWGGQITNKALIALAVFLVLVSIYISIRYERDMAIAGIAALIFDILVTAGVYSLVGFEVTPATVIGLLTILGFSLYDSVVVFDKVEENTRGILHLNRRTYAEQANLAINQTLMRSINTTVISILPVLSLMIVAVGLLGVGTLKDLALIQLVGILIGSYSSIFFATPLVVSLKEKWGPMAAHTKKVLARREATAQRAAGAQAAPAQTAPAKTGTSSVTTAVRESAAPTASTTPAASATPQARPARKSPDTTARPTGKRTRRR